MKGYLLHIIFLLCSSISALGQLATSPNFHADIPRGCAPLTVKMINDYTATNNGQSYKFPGLGWGEKNDTTFTFTQPGVYTISQAVILVNNLITSIQVEVLAQPIPHFQYFICKDKTLNVNITETIYDKYIIDYGDGKKDTINKGNLSTISHIYSDTLDKTLTITGAYLPTYCGNSTTVPIKPIGKLIFPEIRKLTVNDQSSNGKITLDFIAFSNQRYYLQQKEITSATYTTIDTLLNLSGYQKIQFPNLSTNTKQYCYRLISFDDCGDQLISDEVCSIINNVQVLNKENDVTWQGVPAGTLYQYSVSKNITSLMSVGKATHYEDKNVICGEQSCYAVTAEITKTNGSTLQSISDSICVTGSSTNIPPAVQNLNSTYKNNKEIDLTWTQPSAGIKNYSLQRGENGIPPTQYTTFTTNQFSDNKIEDNTEYCYQINYTDNCKNVSPNTSNTCPVLLTLVTDPNNIFQNNLFWSTYSGATSVQNYVLEKLDEKNNLLASFPSSSFNYVDIITNQSIQLIRYQIKVVDNSGNGFSYSNVVEIKYEGTLFLPNVFSPNGDGKNDIFISKHKFLKDYKLTVYNRWGEVVFLTTDLNEGWDGTYNGNPVIPDSYAYLVEANDLWNKKITKRGSITVLR